MEVIGSKRLAWTCLNILSTDSVTYISWRSWEIEHMACLGQNVSSRQHDLSTSLHDSSHMEVFSEIGVPLNHPFIDGFSAINYPAIAVPPFMETPSDRPAEMTPPSTRQGSLWSLVVSLFLRWSLNVGFWMFLIYIHYRIRSSHLSRCLDSMIPHVCPFFQSPNGKLPATASAQPEPHKAPTRHQRKPEAVLRGLH